MFRFEVEPAVTVPIEEATLATFFGVDPVGKLIIVRNLDEQNTLTYKWQRSSDGGLTWTDIAESSTIAPGQSKAFLRAEQDGHLRLRGSGLLTASIAVVRSQAFTGSFSLAVI